MVIRMNGKFTTSDSDICTYEVLVFASRQNPTSELTARRKSYYTEFISEDSAATQSYDSISSMDELVIGEYRRGLFLR